MSEGVLYNGPDVGGREQMQIDRMMLRATEEDAITRIRLYRFVPPTLSLGFNQKISDIDIEKCEKSSYDIVHRPTGGRAVLHKGDIIYSITHSAAGVDSKTPLHIGVYNLVSLALISGLNELDIPATSAEQHRFKNSAPSDLPKLCFSSSTKHEVQVDGKKLVGSAQRRGYGAILQHGSILVTEEYLEVINLLKGINQEQAGKLLEAMQKRTIHIHAINNKCDFDSIINKLSDKFCEVFETQKTDEYTDLKIEAVDSSVT
ncbi:hypothetical protein K8I28_15475 [bacterium]|nr:hypothetical protein [bacterium]